MSHELICNWLGLSPGEWPPDHFRLLGLAPGEADGDRIEQQVHQRLEAVRRYQLLHPDIVTEAMNRLAQAYICLTDPVARRAYEAGRGGKPASPVRVPVPAAPAPPPVVEETRPRPSVAPVPPLPPPLEPGFEPTLQASEPTPAEPVSASPIVPELPPLPVLPEVPTVVTAPAPEPQTSVKVDPAAEAGRSSRAAQRGLGTKRALYHRLATTRRLLRAWEATGKYLSDPARRLTRPSEATELINQLKSIGSTLEDFPRLLGEGGQPGYSVVVLARQQAPVPIFQTLLPGQRDTLAQHWKSGRQLLLSHRDYLRGEVRALRKKSRLGRAYRAVRATLTDQPGVLLLLLALIALNVAIWRQFVLRDWLDRDTAPSRPTAGTPQGPR